MFGNNNYNNRNNGPNINTSLSIFSNPESDCALRLAAWNRQLSVRFAQATGVRPDGLKEYDWKSEHVGLTSLSIENCVILANEYESVIKPAMEAHQPKKVTIEIGSTGQKKSFSLGYDGSSAFVQLALNVNENGATDASHVLTYKFAKKAIYDDMNVLTGEGTERAIESELLRFIEALKMVIFFGPEVGHGIRLDKETRAAFANNRNAGAQAPYGGQGPNNGYGVPAGNSFNVPTMSDDELPFN